jgi:uncharacterized protein
MTVSGGQPLGFARRTTPLLRRLVEQYQQTLPTPQFDSFIAFLRERFERDTALLAAIPPGPARARRLHELVEAEMAKVPRELPVTCARGCSACCHLEVQIAASEGQLLAELMRAGHPVGHRIDMARLAEQAARPDRDAAWMAGVVTANRCIFLDGDEACSIYEDRPATCRKHLVTTPAALCADPHAFPQPVLVPLADVLVSAALSLEEEAPVSIAKSVARALPDDDPV